MIDLDALSKKILDERAGLIPPGSVTVEELRAALEQQRQRFASRPASEPRTTRSTSATRGKATSNEVLAAIGDMKLPGMDKPLFPE